MNNTLRTLNYMTTLEHLRKIDDTDEYFDLIVVGSLLNAITYAHKNGVGYQLATFALDHGLPRETIYLTGGLLFNAFTEAERLIKRYAGERCIDDFENLLDSFTYYIPPEVLLEMGSIGPFRLSTKKRDFSFSLHGKHELFPTFTAGHRGIAVATIANESETIDELKRGNDPEVHTSVESVVSYLVDEFTLAAEEFIFAVSKKLGLKTVKPAQPKQLKLAA